MKVKIDGSEYVCISAKRTRESVVITRFDPEGEEYTTTFSGCDIVETADVIEGAWEYDALAEPSQADRIEAQVTYTAMMTDTLLEV